MTHILENTYPEIKKSESFFADVKNVRFYLFFSDNFKGNYRKFITYKKIFLLHYSSLYSDILVDTKSANLIASEIKNVEKSIVYITDSIESTVTFLSKIKINSKDKKNIVDTEQRFLFTYISQFKQDLHNWMIHHWKELSGEISALRASQNKMVNIDYRSVLELQVKRLEQQIQKVSNLVK